MEKQKPRVWLMKKRGLATHQQVADHVGISRSYYTEIESGKKNPSVVTAKKIALALRFRWTIFFDEDGHDMKQIGGS